MFRVELFQVNPITDQANQATNQDLERLDQVEDENVLSEKEIEILNLVRMQPSITQKEMANEKSSKPLRFTAKCCVICFFYIWYKITKR
mgnify:CR=1 FL=1